jgi:hypothetical protein
MAVANAHGLLVGILIAGVEKISFKVFGGFLAFNYIAFLMPILSYQQDLSSSTIKIIWTLLALWISTTGMWRKGRAKLRV